TTTGERDYFALAPSPREAVLGDLSRLQVPTGCLPSFDTRRATCARIPSGRISAALLGAFHKTQALGTGHRGRGRQAQRENSRGPSPESRAWSPHPLRSP